MPVIATCACGATYNLKDEYAGQTLGCPACGDAVEVPQLPPPPPRHEQPGDPVFARDKFLLDERHLSISERYTVADKDGAPVMYVERPSYPFTNLLAYAGALAAGAANVLFSGLLYSLVKELFLDPFLMTAIAAWQKLGTLLVVFLGFMTFPKRRHVTVYRDDSKKEALLRIIQERRLQLLQASYLVQTPEGEPIVRLRKMRLRNIFRKRWYCLSPEGRLLFIAREDSMILSMLRRFLLGFFGLLRTNFVIYGPGWQVLGEFNRRMTLQDRYVLDLEADGLRSIDRRAALALGVMLDTGEGR